MRCHANLLILCLYLRVVTSVLSEKLCDKNVTVFGDIINGTLYTQNGEIYPSEHFREINSSEKLFIACECSINTPCVWKCCGDGHIIMENGCNFHSHPLLNPFKVNIRDEEGEKQMTILFNDPKKHGRYQLDPNYTMDAYTLFSNGSLYLYASQTLLTNEEFCLEVDPESDMIVPFVPFDEEMSVDEVNIQFPIYPIGMIISEPFLFITFLVYAIEPSLRSLHGLCLMGNVISLFVAYLFLTIIQLSLQEINSFFCISSGYIIQFSFLSHFFWLNVMCFDLWWTFRSLKKASKDKENKKYILYSIYAWGWPFLIIIISLLLDWTPNMRNQLVTPKFGEENCWFKKSSLALLYYFYLPIAIVVICNIIFFILTAINILRLKRETLILKNSESRKHNERQEKQKQRFALYLKLFAVMGVNWSMEVISWKLENLNYLWYITDFMNTIQGVFIFLIFVCKSNIRKMVFKRLCCSKDTNTTPSVTSHSHSYRNSKV